MNGELLLIDLSSIAYPIYLTTQADPDANKASHEIAARVRTLAGDHPRAAICCDSGRSFRHELTAGSERGLQYKGNRPEREAPLHHQISLAVETLAADGFPVWSVKGFEADDLIAAATARALAMPELTVLIVSSDKDLLQLVGERVRAKSAKTGDILDAAVVEAKFGVEPAQLRDYLTLVGDASDNIKGARGIGEKTAAQLLKTFGSLDAIYEAIAKNEAGLKPAVLNSLIEFQPRMPLTRTLVTLRTDVDIPFDEIVADRVQKDGGALTTDDDDTAEPELEQPSVQTSASPPPVDGVTVSTPAPGTAIAVRETDVQGPEPEWEMQLEPRSMKDAKLLATDMHASRLFSAYGTPAAILSTVMAGRELGMQAMASLRAFHIIEGRPTLAADLIRALVIRSGKAKYFRCTERTSTRATFETQRGDDPPISLTYTVEEGRTAFAGKPDAWEKSGWGRNSADMCVARASTKLARLVYADVIHGLYAAEEID